MNAQFGEDQSSDNKSLLISLLAFIVSIISLLVASQHKRVDVTMQLQQGFDDLIRLKAEILEQPNSKQIPEQLVFDWFYRFWSLHIRQYEYWLHGYISSDLFGYWLRNRRADQDSDKGPFDHRSEIKLRTHLQGWVKVRQTSLIDKHPLWFGTFMDNVLVAKDDATLERYIRRARRQLFGYWPRAKRRCLKIIRYLFHQDTPTAEKRFMLSKLKAEDIDQKRVDRYKETVAKIHADEAAEASQRKMSEDKAPDPPPTATLGRPTQ